MPGGAVNDSGAARLRRFVVEHLDDRKMIVRAILLALFERRIGPDEFPPFARYLFTATDIRGFFENLLAYFLVARRTEIDDAWIGAAPRIRPLYPAMANWLKTLFIDRRPALPPVGNTSGMVFTAMLLDVAESHLLSIRDFEHAELVSVMRGRLDHALLSRERAWLLDSGFIRHIGHVAYAAVLLQHQATGRLGGHPIRIVDGTPANPFLASALRDRLVPGKPDDVQYLEMISIRKRFQMADGSMAVMDELVSEAATRWTSGEPFLRLDDATRARGDDMLASLGVPPDAPMVTLHVRESGYNPAFATSMQLRNAGIENYRLAVEALAARGIWVVRLGDPSMRPAPPCDHFVDYPFTVAKSDWMDVYLAARCRFHIGTSSGMSFVPLMYGRPALFTNWGTLAYAVRAPAVLTLPKVLVDRDGAKVRFADYCDRHRVIIEVSDAVPHGLTYRENSPQELRDAARFMDDAVTAGGGAPRFPAGCFQEQQAVYRASPMRTGPQIPPSFWDAHYAGG